MEEAVRKTGIGGSDVAAVMGISPWRTPLQVWMEKTGRESYRPDRRSQERMYWGTRLEDQIARHYASVHDVRVQRVNQTMRLPDNPIVMGHIDRAVCLPGTAPRWRPQAGMLTGASGILEIKTANERALFSGDWGEPGTDEVPKWYWAQVQWYLGLTKVERGTVAALFGGQEYREYHVNLDEDIFRQMVEFASAWWNRHVVGDVPPPPMSVQDVQRLFPEDSGASVEADDEMAGIVQQATALKAEIEERQARYDQLVDKIKMAIGEASELVYKGRTIATWKASKSRDIVDWKAVALECGAPQSVIDAHKTSSAPVRRFVLKGGKNDGE